MIKTLRITSIIAAVLAVGFFVFSTVFGFRSDEEIEQFLNSPGVIEKFRQAKGDKVKGSESRISPLVKQAKAFARYLNPPPKPKRHKPPVGPDKRATEITKPAVTPKFKVIATSYYESHPELSLALINEPGKGLHWVRQSSEVSHLTIEQVKDGLVVVRGSKGTFELVVERPARRSLLAGSSTSPIGSEFGPALGSGQAASSSGADAGIPSVRPPSAEESAALMEKLISGLEAMQTGVESDKIDSGSSAEESAAIMEKLFSDFKAMRISGEEAKRLDDLGKELRDVEQDPNRVSSPKIERPRRPASPRSSRSSRRRDRK